MSERLATVLFALAVIAIPINVASKFVLGLTGAVWVDPTLVLAVFGLLILIPRWGDFLIGDLRLVVAGARWSVSEHRVCGFRSADSSTFLPV